MPLPGRLAERMAGYLATHPHRDDPTAVLSPNRALGGRRAKGQLTTVPLDFSEPVEPTGFYKNALKQERAETRSGDGGLAR